MTTKQLVKVVGTVAIGVAIVIGGMLIRSARVQAHDEDSEESRIQQGFAIAPVPLNLAGKNRALARTNRLQFQVGNVVPSVSASVITNTLRLRNVRL